jgi:hypothetical protein
MNRYKYLSSRKFVMRRRHNGSLNMGRQDTEVTTWWFPIYAPEWRSEEPFSVECPAH